MLMLLIFLFILLIISGLFQIFRKFYVYLSEMEKHIPELKFHKS